MKTGNYLEEHQNQEFKQIKARQFPAACKMIARQFIKKWWWVFVFSFSSTLLYTVAYGEKKQATELLSLRLGQMQQEKQVAQEIREDFLLKLASEEDPAWIEMILMRDLGVVPDGWLKVHFEQ